MAKKFFKFLNRKQKKGKNMVIEDNLAIEIKEEDKQESEFDIDEGSLTLKDFIYNSGIDFTDPRFFIQNNKFYMNHIVKEFPRDTYLGYLQSILELGDIDMVKNIYPVDKLEALDKIDTKITSRRAELRNNDDENREDEINQRIEDLRGWRHRIQFNSDKAFYGNVLFNINGYTAEEIVKNSLKLQKTLRGENFGVQDCLRRHDEALKTILPTNTNYYKDIKRNFSLDGIVDTFTYNNFELAHENGLPIGINLTNNNNSAVLYNQFDPSLPNHNIFIGSPSGQGKSTTIKTLASRFALLGNMAIAAIDPEGENNKYVNAIGGVNVVFDQDREAVVNPLDLDEEYLIDDNTKRKVIDIKTKKPIKQVALNKKITDGIVFFKYMIEGQFGQKLSGYEVYSLGKAITGEYNRRKITTKVDDLYYLSENAMKTTLKSMPTISDVFINLNQEYYGIPDKELFYISEGNYKIYDIFKCINVIDEYEKKGSIKNKRLENVAPVLKIFTRGQALGLFDGHTKVELDITKPFINFDVSKLNDFTKKLAMNFIMLWLWEKFIKKYPDVKKVLILDEAHLYTHDEELVKFVENVSRRIRKYNGSLCCISQSYSDFMDSEQAYTIIKNSHTQIFLKQKEEEIDKLQNIFKISDSIKEFLLKADVGEGYMKVGTMGIRIYFNPSKEELDLYNTNKNISYVDEAS